MFSLEKSTSFPDPSGNRSMTMAVVDSEAAIIGRICSDFASGVTAHEIARSLNAEEVPGTYSRNGNRLKAFRWTARLIYSVLRRQNYRGTLLSR
jgi:Recombinase